MAVVKLPSGRTVKIPDGKSEAEAMEFLFENLDGKEGFEEDRDKIGSQLDTSGWGATIGGTIGGLGGAAAGIFTSPSLVANPITLGVAGSGAGAGIGEAIEQWITGKGDLKDIGRETASGAAWGVVPGVGGQVAKGVGRAGLGAVPQIAGSAGVGAGLGAGISGASGVDPRVGAVAGALGGTARGAAKATTGDKGFIQKGYDFVRDDGFDILKGIRKHTGLNKQVDSLGEAVMDPGRKYLSGMFKQMTGRTAAGGLEKAAAKWDFKRNLSSYLYNQAKKVAEANGIALNVNSKRVLRDQMDSRADDLIKEALENQKLYKEARDAAAEAGTKPKLRWDSETKTYVDDAGVHYDPKSGTPISQGGNFDISGGGVIGKTPPKPTGPATMFAQGGEVSSDKISKIYNEGYTAPGQAYAIAKNMGYAEGGQTRRSDPKGNYAARIAESGALGTIADFIPIVGDVKGAIEVYEEIQKPNPNWLLIGALGGAGVIGLIPGVGDAVAGVIKTGAKKGLDFARKVDADPDLRKQHIDHEIFKAHSKGMRVDAGIDPYKYSTNERSVNIPATYEGDNYPTALEEFIHNERIRDWTQTDPSPALRGGGTSHEGLAKALDYYSDPAARLGEETRAKIGSIKRANANAGLEPGEAESVIESLADYNAALNPEGKDYLSNVDMSSFGHTPSRSELVNDLMDKHPDMSFDDAQDAAEYLLESGEHQQFKADINKGLLASAEDNIPLKGTPGRNLTAPQIHDSYDAVLKTKPEMTPGEFIDWYKGKGYNPSDKQSAQFIKLREGTGKADFEAKQAANRARRRNNRTAFAMGGLLE